MTGTLGAFAVWNTNGARLDHVDTEGSAVAVFGFGVKYNGLR